MSSSPSARWAGPLSVAAAVLTVLSQVLRLGVGLMVDDSAPTVLHTATYVLALLGLCVLMLALTAIYTGAVSAYGRLGFVGYLTAFLGTLLVAGDWWFEAFVVPTIAAEAPEVLERSPGGSVLAGAIVTLGVYSVGWVLFGLATLRTGLFPRPAAVLLLVGGLAGPLALSTPYQIPLAVAVGWIGYALSRAPRGPDTAPAAGTFRPRPVGRSSA
jgi:hypothetical protein